MSDVYVVLHISTTTDENGIYSNNDSSEIIEMAWALVDYKTLEESCNDFVLIKPINAPITPLCTNLTALTWEHVRNAGTLKDAINKLDDFLKEEVIAKNLEFSFVTLNSWDLRMKLPKKCKERSISLPPYLELSRYFDLKKEIIRWQEFVHPEFLRASSASSSSSSSSSSTSSSFIWGGNTISLSQVVQQLDIDLTTIKAPTNQYVNSNNNGDATGTSATTTPVTNTSISTDSTVSLPAQPNQTQTQTQSQPQQQQQQQQALILNAPRRASEEVELLVRIMRALIRKAPYNLPIFKKPHDSHLDLKQFFAEKSKILYMSNLPIDTTQSELESWFTQFGGRPIAFWSLKMPNNENGSNYNNGNNNSNNNTANTATTANNNNNNNNNHNNNNGGNNVNASNINNNNNNNNNPKPTATGFAIFATHEEAVDSLAMNGRLLNEKVVEVQPSSVKVLDRSQEILTPFPSSKNRPRPGDWTCPSCGFSNFQRRTACFRCSFPAASAAAIQESMYPNDASVTSAIGTGSGINNGTNGHHHSNFNTSNSGTNANSGAQVGHFMGGNTNHSSGGINTGLQQGYNSNQHNHHLNNGNHNSGSNGGNNRNANSVPFRAGDWKCINENCAYHNFAKNICCLKCGAPRVSSTIIGNNGNSNINNHHHHIPHHQNNSNTNNNNNSNSGAHHQGGIGSGQTYYGNSGLNNNFTGFISQQQSQQQFQPSASSVTAPSQQFGNQAQQFNQILPHQQQALLSQSSALNYQQPLASGNFGATQPQFYSQSSQQQLPLSSNTATLQQQQQQPSFNKTLTNNRQQDQFYGNDLLSQMNGLSLQQQQFITNPIYPSNSNTNDSTGSNNSLNNSVSNLLASQAFHLNTPGTPTTTATNTDLLKHDQGI